MKIFYQKIIRNVYESELNDERILCKKQYITYIYIKKI
jgi:hypothetical protein